MSLEQLNDSLSVLVVLGQVFIPVAIIYLLFFKKHYSKINKLIADNSILLAFIVALVSVLSSLYYSQVAHFIPCELCWFQRIFMYPLVVLLGLALIKKKDEIIDYALALVVIGTLFSLYHNYIYYSAETTNFCSIVAPCTQKYITSFGYISIPLMDLTAFLMIGLLLINKRVK